MGYTLKDFPTRKCIECKGNIPKPNLKKTFITPYQWSRTKYCCDYCKNKRNSEKQYYKYKPIPKEQRKIKTIWDRFLDGDEI